MNERQIDALTEWLTEAGLAGMAETDILTGLCERLSGLGAAVGRAIVIIDTLHPIHEGRLFTWVRARGTAVATEYGRTDEGENTAARWRQSPFYHLLQTGRPYLRRRLTAETEHEFPHFADLRAEGLTDYAALVKPFASSGSLGEMDCVYASWASDGRSGFDGAEVDAIVRLMPALSLAVKSVSLTRVAETLVETYLGRDAGRRVLSGRSPVALPTVSRRCSGSATFRAIPALPTRSIRKPSSRSSTRIQTPSSRPSR